MSFYLLYRRKLFVKNIEIIPLYGIRADGAEIRFGDSLDKVKAALGEPCDAYDDSLYYCNNELRIDLGSNGAEFIEFLGGIDGELQPEIYGVPAFQTDADKLYEILAKENDGIIDDSEDGYSYGFNEISVGVYRASTPESVQEMINDAKENGEQLDEEYIAEETRRASHWDTIGIGVKNYYE